LAPCLELGLERYQYRWTGEYSFIFGPRCNHGLPGLTNEEKLLTPRRDREWQKWPVTIVTGAYIGYAVGKLLGSTVLKGKKIMFA
jgi:hypothetical protein